MHAQNKIGLIVGALVLMTASPAAGATMTQISGDAYYDKVQCPGPPEEYKEFDTYDGLVMEGDLEGCLYTDVTTSKETPSGVYLESGREVFIGTLDGGPEGAFVTTYRFESKWDDTGAEIHGRCQHPIVEGSGTGGFEGATGRLDMKDIIGAPIPYRYRGHIALG